MDFIQGEKFVNVADQIYSTKHTGTEYNIFNYTFNINTLKNYDIVYTNAHYIDKLFIELNKTDKKIILITHNSDLNITILPPKNVIKWYAQNVNIVDDRIESIPIGLENNRWFKEINKKGKIMNKLKENKNFKNLLYINHNINTNRKEREEPYKIFNDKNWVTLQKGFNGEDYNRYIDNIYNHKFILCPEGNGIDTHRTWECLYMNTIPIEKININNKYYTNLPILFVKNWKEITEEFLINEYIKLSSYNNLEELLYEYWKNKILNYKKIIKMK